METATVSSRLGHLGEFTIFLPSQRRQAATGPGLAQVLGRPLQPGERAIITGTIPRGTTLLVRAIEGRHLATAVFTNIGPLDRAASVLVRASPSGYPSVVLMWGSHTSDPSLIYRQKLHYAPHWPKLTGNIGVRRPTPLQTGRPVGLLGRHRRCEEALSGRNGGINIEPSSRGTGCR